ncbi:hypothetical protein C1I60_22550 [Paenibacillus terrae]|uniref:Uncharacterized protein n=1 Tax=Paenibacillus terrae TaxID=159743 RepID=A0A4U2PU78_9BACL|nr:hypothetical protein [Paenibacillus terrae]TKH42080.1 hypothetical protein C1I60_22550 [Paenibacillus terrae]
MNQPLLEKYKCIKQECDSSFLVNIEKSQGKDLICPYCESTAEAVANENPDSERGLVQGCLYPW